ncbi:IS66 family insertion sequence element accessory protein TnpA [Desulfosporosinus sp. SB140]|uniref:IS66 family insertion sequence element accessory protein TnpA n=1 Tax=Desulfosporosinus paludis TaxID=3115649 RepID=UPI0038905447
MARDLALEQRWRDRIKEYRQSGLSVKEWCLQNGLKNTSFHYWVKKFKIIERQDARDNTFAEVVLLPEGNNSTEETLSMKSEFSLSFGDYSISIPDGFNPITLAELVKVLQTL